MALYYTCRHCNVEMGKLEQTSIHTEQIGLHKLNDEERQEMVTYDSAGNIYIKAICEDCHESLKKDPTRHQYDHLIH